MTDTDLEPSNPHLITLEEWLNERAERKRLHEARLDRAFAHVEILLRERAEPEPETEQNDPDTSLDSSKAAQTTQPEPEPEPFTAEELADFRMPAVELLNMVSADDNTDPTEAIKRMHIQLQATFDNFGIDARVMDAQVGPRVTQFRVSPGTGTKVEAVAALDRNIALGLSCEAVRMEAPIPGEPFVGVEIPNPIARPVGLREAFESQEWSGNEMNLPVVMGVDIRNRLRLLDLAAAPHLLIAGATGSGKSVCINNLILSLLYRFRPDELELVLVDPKKVEFSMYKKLPHLIHPVVDDPAQACQALKWLVSEMERRYEVLAEKHVRNLVGYNAKAATDGFPPMPWIVLVVDELADLMMTARDDVEMPIARLAQMSRAVGIHTVLATQRPSVNVITGVIKANYPTRAAFKVSSQVDSRTILDGKGAEALQGKGDMLFQPPGASATLRLQSPFVSDTEIEGITESLKVQLPPRYRVKLEEPESESGTGGDDLDPLVKQALEIIASTQRASTSFIQRRLKIGYNRAANLIEELEARGYIGPQIDNNPREIFINR